MEKTATKKATAKELKQQQEAKDVKRAKELMKVFTDLKEEQDQIIDEWTEKLRPLQEQYNLKAQPIKEAYDEKLAPVMVSMDEAKRELLEIANRNKKQFGPDDNWNFEDTLHYLHLKSETVPKLGKEFSLDKFIKKFGEYVNVTYRIADLKKALMDADLRSKFLKLDFDLKFNKSVELKTRKEKA